MCVNKWFKFWCQVKSYNWWSLFFWGRNQFFAAENEVIVYKFWFFKYLQVFRFGCIICLDPVSGLSRMLLKWRLILPGNRVNIEEEAWRSWVKSCKMFRKWRDVHHYLIKRMLSSRSKVGKVSITLRWLANLRVYKVYHWFNRTNLMHLK